MPKTASAEEGVTLRRLTKQFFEVPIIGTAPLIVNRWSEKAKAMMLASQQSSARAKKEPKDPDALFNASRYQIDAKQDGFPAVGFKAAIVYATRLFDGITMVQVKQTCLVVGEGPDMLVPIKAGKPTMREDAVRNASGVADLRYRAQYWPWSAKLIVQTIAGQMDKESVLALVDAAGIGGVGEWRPTAPKSATGTFGTFEVVES